MTAPTGPTIRATFRDEEDSTSAAIDYSPGIQMRHRLILVRAVLRAFIDEAMAAGLSGSNLIREISSLLVLLECSMENHMGAVRPRGRR